MSSKLDLASGWRNSDFGVNTISWCRSDKERERAISDRNVMLCAGGHSRLHTHRLPEGQQDLSAEDMEVVRGRGAVDDNPVTVVQLTHSEVLGHNLAGTGWRRW